MSRRQNLAAAGSAALGVGTFNSPSAFDIGRLNSKPFDGMRTSNMPGKPTTIHDSKSKTQTISVGGMEKDLRRDIDELDWELDKGSAAVPKKTAEEADRNNKLKPRLFFKKEEKKGFNDTGETRATAGNDLWDLPTGGVGSPKKTALYRPAPSMSAAKKPLLKDISERSNAGEWDLPQNIPSVNISTKQGVKVLPHTQASRKKDDLESKVVGVRNIKNNVHMELEAQDAEFEKLYQCPEGCGRSFKRNALEKHIKICRSVFSGAEVSDNKQSLKNRGASVQVVKKDPGAGNRSESVQKWKKDSEQFRKMLRQGKGVNEDELPGIDLHMPEQPQTACDICTKSFNEQAYIRHRPLCESKKKYMEGGHKK